MTLELFSAVGALVGGLIAFMINEQVLAGLFAVLLAVGRGLDGPAQGSTQGARRRRPQPRSGGARREPRADPADPAPVLDVAPAAATGAELSFTASLSGPGYGVHRLPAGMLGSVFAGVNSALLGVGGGIIKVPVMHLVMGVPLRTSTATSNMMMGITATASAVIYLLRDEIDPFIAGPIALGVFVGASVGSRVAHRVDVRILRWLFVVVLVYTAVQMATRALGL